jgi:peptidoglycan hydrolase CwlO-like protein
MAVVGVSKEKITFRVDSDTKRRLTGKHTNLSGLMRDLAERYSRRGDTVEASLLVEREELEQRVKDLERDKADIESEINSLMRDIDRIDKRLEQRRENVTAEATELAEMVEEGSFRLANLEEDNIAVQNHANNAGLEVGEFIFEVREELNQ